MQNKSSTRPSPPCPYPPRNFGKSKQPATLQSWLPALKFEILIYPPWKFTLATGCPSCIGLQPRHSDDSGRRTKKGAKLI